MGYSGKERLGSLLTVFILTIFYIPISKFAIDSLIWHTTLSQSGRCYVSPGAFNWVFILPRYNSQGHLTTGLSDPSICGPSAGYLHHLLSLHIEKFGPSLSSAG